MVATGKDDLLRKIRRMTQTEITKSQLKWLRGLMESDDGDIRGLAEAAHSGKYSFLNDYSRIKGSSLVKVEFYAQGAPDPYADDDDDWHDSDDYRHIRYSGDADGNIKKTIYFGDSEYTGGGQPVIAHKTGLRDVKVFLRLFLEKIDEVFGQYFNFSHPAIQWLPKTRDDDEDWDSRTDYESGDEVDGSFQNEASSWSMKLTFANGETRSAMDCCALYAVDDLLHAFDEYFDKGRMMPLEYHSDDWLSED